MFKYAQLNNENVVIGISQLGGEVVADNMILINDLVVEQGSTYNPATDEFTPPEPQPIPEATTSAEEIARANLLEMQYQTVLIEMLAGV